MARFVSLTVIFFAGFISLAMCGTQVIKDGEYDLAWTIANGNITVSASAKTLGWVGFGISPYGSMMEADLILSGRNANGNGYIQDSWAFSEASPVRDQNQDATLISATENATHTTVTFTRKLDTGDVPDDKPILNATQYIIWSYGPTDNFNYHGPNRGVISINLVESA